MPITKPNDIKSMSEEEKIGYRSAVDDIEEEINKLIKEYKKIYHNCCVDSFERLKKEIKTLRENTFK